MTQDVEFPWEELFPPEPSSDPSAEAVAEPSATRSAADAPVDATPELVSAIPEDGDVADIDDGVADEGANLVADGSAGVVSDGSASGAADERTYATTAESAAAQPAPREAPTRTRKIARKEYYSIGEVSELVGLPAHVLRYWEEQFRVLNPSKNRSGNRAYQRKEIRLILLVKQLLYEDKYTIEGAKTRLEQLRKGGDINSASAGALDREMLSLLRQDIAALRQVLTGANS